MYPKANIDAVSERLREYEEVIAPGPFQRLNECRACDSVDYRCNRCLFNGKAPSFGCIPGPGARIGILCDTKTQQRAQFKHLLKRLDECGYEFKNNAVYNGATILYY